MRCRPFLPTVLNLAALLFDYADCKFIILKAPDRLLSPIANLFYNIISIRSN